MGADGVVGMRLEMEREGHHAEFVAMGTAVRRRTGDGAAWRDRHGRPFTSDLSGVDFWALVRARLPARHPRARRLRLPRRAPDARPVVLEPRAGHARTWSRPRSPRRSTKRASSRWGACSGRRARRARRGRGRRRGSRGQPRVGLARDRVRRRGDGGGGDRRERTTRCTCRRGRCCSRRTRGDRCLSADPVAIPPSGIVTVRELRSTAPHPASGLARSRPKYRSPRARLPVDGRVLARIAAVALDGSTIVKP